MNYPDTDQLVRNAMEQWQAGQPGQTRTLRLARPWRTPADVAVLEVDYHCAGSPAAPRLSATVAGKSISLDDPVALEPVHIPKPWGQEVWFSGIESRGESRVVCQDGGTLNLSSYLALAPEHLCRRAPLVLLKILDPRPEPLLGELYLEVHEDKREVYLVTYVEPAAWPDGRGRIRYGINQDKRRLFPNDAAFRAAFLDAIEHYEAIRESVDAGLPGLEETERAAREATLEFTAERDLRQGDVISVPTWVPHSLQQGVQVVEFQTPSYERHIISSSQRVLTQDGWDSRIAISGMSLDLPPEQQPDPVQAGIDRIVCFDDFSVWRADLGIASTIRLPAEAPYALVMCISGQLTLHGCQQTLTLNANQAGFVPAASIGQPICSTGPGLALLAAPGL